MNSLLKEYALKDERIRLYFNEKNLGLPLTLNKALTYCRGDYIARMDADDYAYPDRFEKQLEYLLNNDLDLVGGFCKVIGTDKGFFQISGEKEVRKWLIDKDVLGHSTWLCKNTFYSDLNGYRNILACEDYDLLLRALKKGKRMDNLNRIVIKYRLRESSISKLNKIRQQITTNYLSKNHKIIDKIDENTIRNDVDVLCERELAKNRKMWDENLIEEYKQQKKYMAYVLYWLKFLFDGQRNRALVKNMIKYKLSTLRIRG